MLRAVPSTILAAPSMSAAFRSGILVLAISSTCARVTVPTFSRFGSPLPLSSPAACLSRNAARGVFELPHELPDVHLRLAQGRADRRGRVRLPAGDLQLQLARDAPSAPSTHKIPLL